MLLPGQTVTDALYVTMLKKSPVSVQQSPIPGSSTVTMCHTAFSVIDYLAEHRVPMVPSHRTSQMSLPQTRTGYERMASFNAQKEQKRNETLLIRGPNS